MYKFKIKFIFILSILTSVFFGNVYSAEKTQLLKQDWSFDGITGKFDRASLQRGYQVYTEVCASCHSMRLLSYRNLGEEGGPEFSLEQVKAIAANFEVTDGPDGNGEMFTRPGRPSDRFVSPYPNIQAATAANGGAYPPDMSVLVKSRKGGADYIYSVLMGYEEPPADIKLDDGVYYNKYMEGKKIKMSNPLSEGIVTYSDGTQATEAQMAKDVTTFLSWAAEPTLEQRHKMGVRVLIFLIIFTILVYLSMKRLWSRIDSEE
ncbi:MAG: cytochrome c1 [Candidatus Marinimicrobia bacterium]|nr:cytochrome c1 [Candidatus Neomarinimicrobiota bacterium]RPG05416.1 MAG: cytochrome c1 [Pelagibacteraceae bacterium TMED247]|tara:strand:+ start:825 stop:1610 length:786 start_codon:yes stop_codon:yes gene_type:complete